MIFNFIWQNKLLFTDSKELPKLVKKYNGLEIKLKEPKGYAVRITDLNGTVYWGRDEMLESWSELYLPESTEMVVIGAIDNFPSLAEGLQLIVLVDSQGKVYFYENEVLHLIAESLEDFFEEGAKSPPIKSYEYGQCL
uniref:SMI1/KNR4 family protein n=1 Tax=Paramormyrops kingsleyae TaxID=1676925 RepID=A0A3B3QQV9_9TELE